VKLASLRPHLAFWGLRSAWVLAVALWALALVPWFEAPAPAPPTGRVVARVAPRGAASAAQPTRPIEEDTPSAEPIYVAQRQRNALTAEPAASPAERAGREGAVCGLTDGPAAASGDAMQSQKASHLARQAAAGLLQAVDNLRARAEPAAQAAGLWLRVLMAREGAADPPPPPTCVAGTDCSAAGALATSTLPTVAAVVDALAQLALAHNDPWLQQIAQRACDGAQPGPATCATLGTRRWSTQEPDNAAAWLELLAARDAQAADEALYGVGQASRFDNQRGRLAAWVVQASPEQAPAMQRYAAWQRADELERAANARVMAAAARACSESARRDANRAQLCDGAARWLAADPRAATATEPSAAASSRALDCATIERQWREARDAAQRGARVVTMQGTTAQRP
jgi:hypothetical protein